MKDKEHYKLGKEYFLDNKYDLAMKHFTIFEKNNRDYADVYNMLGVIYYLKGNIKDAIGSLERSLELNPTYLEAATSLSIIYNDIGQYEKAKNVLNKVKESSHTKTIKEMEDKLIYSRLANMHAKLGDLYTEIDNYDSAIEEYQKALKLQPVYVDIKTKLALALRTKGLIAQAIKELEEVQMINADYIPAKVNLGILYYLMGRYDDAIVELEDVLRREPKNGIANIYIKAAKNGLMKKQNA
ncbi:MAG: tetratricopeptide repeat protein [Deltaproteobacteria bacterium]|nr:tetratricopeptide repeat protein [Deltaproteobacteria bacterium]MCL5792844.1 tetratricopeptide repeat protein [Deltaproteobacteria bacterium]